MRLFVCLALILVAIVIVAAYFYYRPTLEIVWFGRTIAVPWMLGLTRGARPTRVNCMRRA